MKFEFCIPCAEKLDTCKNSQDVEICESCKNNSRLIHDLEQKYDTLHTQFCDIHRRELFLDQEINAVKQDAFDMIREQWEEKKDWKEAKASRT